MPGTYKVVVNAPVGRGGVLGGAETNFPNSFTSPDFG